MSRSVSSDLDLNIAAVDARHAGELLLHACGCNGKTHSLGEHLWRSTKDMEPGLRASNTDPRIPGGSSSNEPDDDDDPTVTLHQRYKQLVTNLQDAALELTGFIGAYRPDRVIALPTPASDDQWCTAHLRVGLCEPRSRDELCWWCYEFNQSFKMHPPAGLILQRHRTPKLKEADVLAAVKAQRRADRIAARNKRKRAS